MSQIKELTAAQEQKLEAYRDKWIKIGLSTEPVNKEDAERALKDVYSVANLKEPMILWARSPMECLYMGAFLKITIKESVNKKVDEQVWNQVGDKVWNQVWDQVSGRVRNQVWNQVWNQVRDKVWNQVGDKVWNQVVGQVRNQVWNQVRSQVESQVFHKVLNQVGGQVLNQVVGRVLNQVVGQVENQVGGRVWNQVRGQVLNHVWNQVTNNVMNQVKDQIESPVNTQTYKQIKTIMQDLNNGFCFGQHDADYLSCYEFFKDECGLEVCNKLEPMMRLAKNCHWFIPFEGLAILSEKPIQLNLDAEGRLHAEGRMAIEYADGFGLYRWHGTNIPKHMEEIKPELWKSEWIITEKNAEVRRILIQGIGYAKIARDLKAKSVNVWKEYELLRIEDVDVEPIMLIKMTCPSTGLLHAHRVPPDITTCREAIKWCNWGIDKEEFIVER